MTIRKVSATSTNLTIAATVYSSGDVVGNRFTFDPAFDFANGLAVIKNIVILDKAGVLGALELWFFGQNATQANLVDNSAPALVDGELSFITGRAVFAATDAVIPGANGLITYSGKDVVVASQSSGAVPNPTGLSCHMITRTANNFFAAVNDIQIDLYVQTGIGLSNN